MARQVKIRPLVYALTVLAALLVASVLFARPRCPPQGWGLRAETRAFAALKNRARLPDAADFDPKVTLEALLEPGDDRGRWSEARAAAIEGYVVGVARGGIEAANCYSLRIRDTHVYVCRGPDAATRECVVAEVTPRMAEWAKGRGLDWSGAALERALVGRRCRVEGWLLFDREHAGESEHLSPGGARNWRATAWEIHPVTGINVLQ